MSLRTLQTRILTQNPPSAPPPPPGGGLIFIVASFTSWDATDPMAPVQVGSAALVSSSLAQVVLSGTTLIWACAAGNGGSQVQRISSIDITAPTAPSVLGTLLMGNGNTRLGSIAISG